MLDPVLTEVHRTVFLAYQTTVYVNGAPGFSPILNGHVTPPPTLNFRLWHCWEVVGVVRARPVESL